MIAKRLSWVKDGTGKKDAAPLMVFYLSHLPWYHPAHRHPDSKRWKALEVLDIIVARPIREAGQLKI